LLPVGHPSNPSKRVDGGFFGDPTKGVNVSRYADYSVQYSNGIKPATVGDVCSVVMFEVIPGKCQRLEGIVMGLQPTPGFDR